MKSGRLNISEGFDYSELDSHKTVCYNKHKNKFKFLIFLIVCCFVILFCIVYFHSTSKEEEIPKYTGSEFMPLTGDQCSIVISKRFDCLPRGPTTEENCISKGCCWGKIEDKNVPWCFYPVQYSSYKFINVSEYDRGITAYLESTITSPYPNDVKLLKLDVQYISDVQLRVKVSCVYSIGF